MKQTLPGLVVFLGSFLVFGVQPVMGRTLLPLFGGIATVWVVCLAVFQTLSLAGYSYAHLLSRASVPDAAAKKLQGALLALSLLLTVALVGLRGRLAAWAGGSPYPVLQEVALICAFVGLPYVLLSANGILVQAWLSRFREQKVYRLYAVSNAGSFCGLLVYPFVLEPWVSLTAQWAGFAVLLALYTALLFFLPHDRGGAPPPGRDGAARGAGRLGLGVRVLWVALPASSCFVLNAVTTHLSEEILPIPLLWIALLALFLLSYVFGFSKKGEGAVEWLCVLTLIPLFGCAHALGGQDANTGFVKNLAFGLLLVLLGSTFIHSWLCRLRPHVGELTAFYMSLSAGGAAGGILAGVVAPVLFKTVFEYPLSLMLVGLLACCFARSRPPAESGRRMALGVYGGVLVCLAVAMAGLLSPAKGRRVLQRARNFYACMRVEKAEFVSDYGEVVESHHLMHGNVTHGYQFLPHYLRKKPTAYFGPHGGG
ncbi:MAG: hypothetical protein LBT60_06295, partial [Oscillospiraceae bacterium]|nr:hypothetical protein [Oscillospiraceae bacterium]